MGHLKTVSVWFTQLHVHRKWGRSCTHLLRLKKAQQSGGPEPQKRRIMLVGVVALLQLSKTFNQAKWLT